MLRLAVVLAAVAALAVPSAAGAAAPQRYTEEFQISDTIDCSEFDPAWQFNDDFTDFFTVRGQLTTDSAGNPVSAIEHIVHRSNDVNSVTGFTIHEHNHITVKYDFIRNTVSLSGAINIAQRPGFGSVIHTSGHGVFDLETGEPILTAGPDQADDEDFCRAVAP
jgi:hypothetical protein